MLKEFNEAVEIFGVRFEEKKDKALTVTAPYKPICTLLSYLMNKDILPRKIRLAKQVMLVDIRTLGYTIDRENIDRLERHLERLAGEVGYAMSFGRSGE